MLNGGDRQARVGFGCWLNTSSERPEFNNEVPLWSEDHWYMLDEFESRIKPKKVKRFVVIHRGDLVSSLYERNIDIRHSYGSEYCELQIFPIEIEE